MRRIFLLAIAVWVILPIQHSALSAGSAEQAHRPADGISAFLEGCISTSGSKQRAEAAFTKYDLATGISNRPQGDFPAGRFHTYSSAETARTGKLNACQVRIRSLWLTSADSVVAHTLKAAGFTQVKGIPAKEKQNGMRIENGSSAGFYSARGKTFFVQVAQVRQKAGRLTELSISQIATQ